LPTGISAGILKGALLSGDTATLLRVPDIVIVAGAGFWLLGTGAPASVLGVKDHAFLMTLEQSRLDQKCADFFSPAYLSLAGFQ